MHVHTYFIAPVCFNTTYCGGESVSNDLLSYEQCCFELLAVSFASPGQCLLCPKSGNFLINNSDAQIIRSLYWILAYQP